jgi:hypothetical protein
MNAERYDFRICHFSGKKIKFEFKSGQVGVIPYSTYLLIDSAGGILMKGINCDI